MSDEEKKNEAEEQVFEIADELIEEEDQEKVDKVIVEGVEVIIELLSEHPKVDIEGKEEEIKSQLIEEWEVEKERRMRSLAIIHAITSTGLDEGLGEIDREIMIRLLSRAMIAHRRREGEDE